MALQIRNTKFDPGDVTRMLELNRMLSNATVIGAVKKSPRARAANPRYTYEIACVGLMLHLEVDEDNASIATLEAAILVFTGANGLVEQDLSNDVLWEIGHYDDLRVG